MKVSFSKNFVRKAKKLDPAMREKVRATIRTFADNPLHPSLRNHPLKGKYKEYRSIGVTGDVRMLYLQREDEAIFDAVGTHSQLYG